MTTSTIKKALNSALIIIFIACMASTFISGAAHEVLGCAFFALLVTHRDNIKRLPRISTVGILTLSVFSISLIVLLISGAELSRFLFSDFRIAPDINWRSIHLGAAIVSLSCMLIHLSMHTRKRRVATVLTVLVSVVGVFGLPYLDRWFHHVEVDRIALVRGDKVSLDAGVLTVYFSRVGNTDFASDVDAVSGASLMRDGSQLIGNAEMIASMVQDCVGGDVVEIKTVDKYPASYSETTKVGKNEILRAEPPEIKPLNINVDNCDVIVVVYPLWWSTLPRAVENFLASTDLTGKKLIPIVTHGGGGVGDSLDAIKRTTSANVAEPLDIYSSDIPSARSDITEYLRSIR